MIITSHIQENAFGTLVNYKLYQPLIPSKYYLVFLHGSGEKGAADGSELNKVEIHGYPKHAKNGFEFPFNIIAPQVVTSYSHLNKILPAYITLKYKAEVLIYTGLSMGGYGTFDTKRIDDCNLIYAIAPVCGGFNYSTLNNSEALDRIVDSYPLVHGWAFHGDMDTIVRYWKSKDFVDRYNIKYPDADFKYTLYPGVAHDAWNKAYATDGELLQWLIQKFAEAPKHPNKEQLKTKVAELQELLK